MRTPIHVYCCLAVLCSSVLTGCATIVSGTNDKVAIRSNPPNAHVAVRNEKGKVVASGVTPMKVKLKRNKGLFKKPSNYTATLQKPGYEPTLVEIDAGVNPWILGNIALGGPIGLAADAASGAVWRMSPSEIHRELTPMQGPTYSQVQPSRITQAAYVSDER